MPRFMELPCSGEGWWAVLYKPGPAGTQDSGGSVSEAGCSNAQHISGVWAAPTLRSEGGGSAPASVLETIHLGPLVLLVFHSPIS